MADVGTYDAEKVASLTFASLRRIEKSLDLVMETLLRHDTRLGRVERDVGELRRDLGELRRDIAEVRSDLVLTENRILTQANEILRIVHRLDDGEDLTP